MSRIETIVEALGYIARFAGSRVVVKYGGAAMTNADLKRSFCDDVRLLHSVGLAPILVHGGGPEISKALEKLGNGAPQFVEGMRVTPPDDMRVVEMVLTGQINTELVGALAPIAVGLSGKDAGLLRARQLVRADGRDLGRVGDLVEVNAQIVEALLAAKYVPVISPVGLGLDGGAFNLNADVVAAGVARALRVGKLIFLSDVEGIVADGALQRELTDPQLRELIARGVVTGGMLVKARAVLDAIDAGVRAVHLVDGRVPHNLIEELFTDRGVGTVVRAVQQEVA